MQIIRGKKAGAIRAVIYGTEGIGKSTLAAQIPDCLVIDTEDGTGQIDCARALCLDWRAIEYAFKELVADTQGFKAVVVDSADWLEKDLIDHMLRQSGKKSIEDFGYGKGYTILQEHVTRFLNTVDQLVAKGVHVVFVAHAKVTRTSPPDQTDGFDRYELKLTKQVAPLLKEWSDLILFCNYKIALVEGADGRVKAQGGRERVMYAVHSAAWDAKNRFGLPDEMPMQFEKIAHLFSAAKPAERPAEQPAKKAVAQPVLEESSTTPAPAFASADQIALLQSLRASNPQAVEDFMEKINAVDLGELTNEQAAELIATISKPRFSAEAVKWLRENAQIANAYLLSVGWIKVGQDYTAIAPERAEALGAKFEKFKTAALAFAAKGKAA